jgi:hypothetical protein
MKELLEHQEEIEAYYLLLQERQEKEEAGQKPPPGQKPPVPPKILASAIAANKLHFAAVLARSSDYYHYGLEDVTRITFVICGLHDSYLHIPAWETGTNRRYTARETAVSLKDPNFDQIRRTQVGHSILLAAYAKGSQEAIDFVKSLPERTRTRMDREKDQFQHQTYRGRPLAFRDVAKRKEAAQNISDGLKHYHATKHLRGA